MLIALALSAATAPVSYARTQPSRLRSCAPRTGVAVLASNRHAQVYERLSSERRAGLYGCLRGGGRAVYLGDGPSYQGLDCPRKEEGHCVSVREQVLVGTVVAYVASPVELGYEQREGIVVRSLATGRALHRVTINVRIVHRTILEEAKVLQIVAKPDGAVAWIQEDSYARHGGGTPPPTAYSIFTVDRDGFRALTPALPVVPRSFTLSESTLSWTNEATRESAVLD